MATQFDRALRVKLREAGRNLARQGEGSHEIWRSPITQTIFGVPIGIPFRRTPMGSCAKRAGRRRFEPIERSGSEHDIFTTLPGVWRY
jgi:hypothetical protein